MRVNGNIDKKYVLNRLMPRTDEAIALAQGNTNDAFYEHGITCDTARELILQTEKGAFKRKIYSFSFKNKEKIKRLPIIGKKVLKIKKRKLENALENRRPTIDLSDVIGLHYSIFIGELYKRMLGRLPDDGGSASLVNMVYNGASNGALAAVVYQSPEFAERANVKNIGIYKKQYKTYIRKQHMKKIPFIGTFLQVRALSSLLLPICQGVSLENSLLQRKIDAAIEAVATVSARVNDLKTALPNIERTTGVVETLKVSAEKNQVLYSKMAEAQQSFLERINALEAEIEKITDICSNNGESVRKSASELQLALSRGQIEIENKLYTLDEKLGTVSAVEEGLVQINKFAVMQNENLRITTSVSEKLDRFAQNENVAKLTEMQTANLQISTSISEKIDRLAENENAVNLSEMQTANLQISTSISEKIDRLAENENAVNLSEMQTANLQISTSISEKIDRLAENENAVNLSEMQAANLQISTSISEKIDRLAENENAVNLSEMQAVNLQISTSISEKLDSLPEFIDTNNKKNRSVLSSAKAEVTAIYVDDFILGLPSDEWGLAMFLSNSGYFEKGSELLFEGVVQPGMNVLDIGANVGIYTLRALRKGCNVFSFEPTPSTFGLLKSNVKVNGFENEGKAHLFNYAVSDSDKTATFHMLKGICGHNSLYDKELKGFDSVNVKCIKLDSFPDIPESIDFIKIDVEGAEIDVLCGMQRLLEKNSDVKILIEFSPINLMNAGRRADELLEVIKRLGFKYSLIDESLGTLSKIDDDELLRQTSVNLMLMRGEERV